MKICKGNAWKILKPQCWLISMYWKGRAGTTRETVARAVSQLRQSVLVPRKDRDKIVSLVEKYKAILGG